MNLATLKAVSREADLLLSLYIDSLPESPALIAGCDLLAALAKHPGVFDSMTPAPYENPLEHGYNDLLPMLGNNPVVSIVSPVREHAA